MLADGTELVAPDRFALAEAAGDDRSLAAWFELTYARAAADIADADPPAVAWQDYLSGFYAVCLRSVTPATIVRKTALVTELERMLASPRQDDREWLTKLETAVDALERPSAAFDGRRFGGPTSRDRLIADRASGFCPGKRHRDLRPRSHG